jgi:ABC-type lipoprotein release transport system permease subunit
MAWIERHAQRPIEYHSLTLELKPEADLDQVMASIERLGLAAPDLDTAKRIGQASLFAQALAGVFALSILLVAAVGIGSGFMVKVQLEKQDIGLYRSLGATRGDIARIYLVRALSLGLQGALLGVLSGAAGGLLLSRFITSYLPKGLSETMVLFQPSWHSFLVALLFGPLVAVAAAWLPARQGAHLEPGKILRG